MPHPPNDNSPCFFLCWRWRVWRGHNCGGKKCVFVLRRSVYFLNDTQHPRTHTLTDYSQGTFFCGSRNGPSPFLIPPHRVDQLKKGYPRSYQAAVLLYRCATK